MDDPVKAFEREVALNIENLAANETLANHSMAWMQASVDGRYSYNFRWLGRPIIQYPQDIIAMQEIIWSVQPDAIIETGVAHGGSLIFSASMLELNAICGGVADAAVIGIDIDIRSHNRRAIESHPLCKRIKLIEGSSIDPEVVQQVKSEIAGRKRVLVCLDSNHTHDHVLQELEIYAPMTTTGSYCVVFDTIIENLPAEHSANRAWAPGNSPMTAVRSFVSTHSEFQPDTTLDHKLLLSVSPNGYLKRIR